MVIQATVSIDPPAPQAARAQGWPCRYIAQDRGQKMICLDYMPRPKAWSGCVRSAPYNRLLSSTAFLTRECFALEQKGAFATQRGRALRRVRWPWLGRADAEWRGCGVAAC